VLAEDDLVVGRIGGLDAMRRRQHNFRRDQGSPARQSKLTVELEVELDLPRKLTPARLFAAHNPVLHRAHHSALYAGDVTGITAAFSACAHQIARGLLGYDVTFVRDVGKRSGRKRLSVPVHFAAAKVLSQPQSEHQDQWL